MTRKIKYAKDVVPGDYILCRAGYCKVTAVEPVGASIELHVVQFAPILDASHDRHFVVNENATVHMWRKP